MVTEKNIWYETSQAIETFIIYDTTESDSTSVGLN